MKLPFQIEITDPTSQVRDCRLEVRSVRRDRARSAWFYIDTNGRHTWTERRQRDNGATVVRQRFVLIARVLHAIARRRSRQLENTTGSLRARARAWHNTARRDEMSFSKARIQRFNELGSKLFVVARPLPVALSLPINSTPRWFFLTLLASSLRSSIARHTWRFGGL